MTSKKAKSVQLNQTRDIGLLVFLWKWKVATTATLSQKFFANIAPATSYRRLWKLEKAKIIESRVDRSGRKWIWMLAKDGYLTVKHHFPNLKEDGFKSEHVGHDLVASAFHLGDWLMGAPRGVELFSEQQLRRYDAEDYPKYIVRQSKLHRPDGYTFIPSAMKNRIFAFEVELHLKRSFDYEMAAWFFEDSQVDHVFWLVPRSSSAEFIYRAIKKRDSRNVLTRHNFVTFPDFLKSGWGAAIVAGADVGQSIRQLLRGDLLSDGGSDIVQDAGKQAQNLLKTESKQVLPIVTLNVAKTIHRSKTCRMFEIGDFAN